MVLVPLPNGPPPPPPPHGAATPPMPIGKPKPNPTLAGHKLLFMIPSLPPTSYLAALQKRYPDLEIASPHVVPWNGRAPRPDELPDGRSLFEGVTLLVTAGALPASRAEAEDVQYVQLMSAGVEHLADQPFWRQTEGEDVAFCNAGGVSR